MKPKLPATLRFVLMGVLVAAAGVALGLWLNRGSHIDLTGKILKVRTISTDDRSAVAVVDFRFVNPARYAFVVSEVRLTLVDGAGQEQEGLVSAQVDLDRLLDYYKLAGPRYNQVLTLREKIAAGAELDRTVAAAFPVSEKTLIARRKLVIRVADVDGAVAEISETN
jgi:hypothetical protein